MSCPAARGPRLSGFPPTVQGRLPRTTCTSCVDSTAPRRLLRAPQLVSERSPGPEDRHPITLAVVYMQVAGRWGWGYRPWASVFQDISWCGWAAACEPSTVRNEPFDRRPRLAGALARLETRSSALAASQRARALSSEMLVPEPTRHILARMLMKELRRHDTARRRRAGSAHARSADDLLPD